MKYFSLFTIFASLFIGAAEIGNIFKTPPPEQPPVAEKRVLYSYHIPDRLEAKSILLFSMKENTDLVGRNADAALPIASVTKLMTVFIALERYHPNEVVTVYDEVSKVEETKAQLRAGEHLYLKDLIALSLTGSANDAATVIADHIGKDLGGRTHQDRIRLFTNLMNQRAKELGMIHTFYQNPTGLDLNSLAPSNYSSAHDLTLLIKKTLAYPLLWELSRQQEIRVRSFEGSIYEMRNTNEIANTVPNYIGGKTGTTDLAGESLVMLFEYPFGHPVLLLLLNMPQTTRTESTLLFLKENNILTYD